MLRFGPELRRVITLTLGIGGLILGLCSGFASASELTSAEQNKIEALLLGIERMVDTEFIRNGKSYQAPVAAEFLRRKWKARRLEIRSAADFIDKVASFSTTTGKPYSMRRRDGQVKLCAEFFRTQLARLERRPEKQPG